MLEFKFTENMVAYGNFKIWIEPKDRWVQYDVYFKDSKVGSFESLEDAVKYVRD